MKSSFWTDKLISDMFLGGVNSLSCSSCNALFGICALNLNTINYQYCLIFGMDQTSWGEDAGYQTVQMQIWNGTTTSSNLAEYLAVWSIKSTLGKWPCLMQLLVRQNTYTMYASCVDGYELREPHSPLI